jgi:hypothetical protein
MSRYVTPLVLALIGPVAWAAEPNETPLHLEFEISSTKLEPDGYPTNPPSAWQPYLSRRPPYAAAIALLPPAEYLPRPSSSPGAWETFLGDDRRQRDGYVEQKGGLSERQKAFLEAVRIPNAGPATYPLRRRLDPNGPECVLLYAMTVEDAKKMALAYYQFARNVLWWKSFSTLSKDVREWTEKVTREKGRLSELDQVLGTSQKSLDGLAKIVPYRTESEAHEAIGELDRMVNAAQVEIAGITAKIEAIQGYRAGQWTERLGAMFVEESIALRGAEARRQMATQLRSQANQFLDLKSTLTGAAAERKTLVESSNGHQEGLEKMQKYLESAKQLEPKIPPKVVIYPVGWSWVDGATRH